MDYKTAGLILKRRREELGLSQRQVADALGYRNYNYISMIETGRSAIPVNKIPAIVIAYNINPAFGCMLLKANFEETWDMAVGVLSPVAEKLVEGENEVNAYVEKVADQLEKQYCR